jgi:hypothetical protein
MNLKVKFKQPEFVKLLLTNNQTKTLNRISQKLENKKERLTRKYLFMNNVSILPNLSNDPLKRRFTVLKKLNYSGRKPYRFGGKYV